MVFVVVTDGTLQGARHEITNDITRIGRRMGNDWILNAPSVSGTHCEIIRNGNNFSLRDLGSTNGTRLNGKRIKDEMPLVRNDVITLGDESIMIDGDEMPMYTDDEMASIPRTTVAIRPQVTGNAKIAPSRYFRKRMDNRKLWFILITLTILAIGIAAFFFLKNEFAPH